MTSPTERNVADARAIRALAHPVRVALLQLLKREGPLTATQAAELLGESPGNMSWHFQTLAKYGFVEETGEGRGRSRPWRPVRLTLDVDAVGDDEQGAAAEALETVLMQQHFENVRAWWAQRRQYPREWAEAAFSMHSTLYLTAEEMRKVAGAVGVLLEPYRGRDAVSSRPAGALPVEVVAFGQPLPAPSPVR
jgi:DNA-binding transcriptional ArsR family regulator